MKTKTLILALLLILNLLVIPLLLETLYLAGEYGFARAWSVVRERASQNPLYGYTVLVSGRVQEPWLWLQVPLGILTLRIAWTLFRKRRTDENDSPEAIKSVGGGQYGTAKWRTIRDVARTLDGLSGKTGGFVVGVKKRRLFGAFDAWVDKADTHCLVIGATRSGKSRRIIMPTIWTLGRAGESMVVTDPKGELHSRSKTYLEQRGYRVVRIDLRDPHCGLRWNLLQPIIAAMESGDASAAGQAAWDAAHTITYQRPHQGDPIWPQAQESLTAALMLAVAAEAAAGSKNMAECYNLLFELGGGDGEMLDAFLRSFPPGHPARSAYGVAGLSSERLRSSIFTGTAAQLRLWADPAVKWLTAENETDVGMVGNEKSAVFLVIPDERGVRNVLASLYISQCYQALADIGNQTGGRLQRRVNFLLDEFGNIPAIPDFDKKLTVSAGRNIRFLLAVQDVSQIKTRYGEAHGTILGNCATWVYLSTADPETAKMLSAKTGQHTVRTESHSSSTRSSTESSTSESMTGRALLMPDEVLRWPKNWALVLQTGQNPAKLRLPDLSQWPADTELKASTVERRTDTGDAQIPLMGVLSKGPTPRHHHEAGNSYQTLGEEPDSISDEDAESLINKSSSSRRKK
ncbi:MAG: type IV secretory system conjugative DNA transfer family protein [Peptococcaceae bacterium]|nr:type IV secretory system conjugative DNA transfer family protein [Peptococcaceae bacterium]